MPLQILATAVADLSNVCTATVDFTGSFQGNTADAMPADTVFCLLNSSAASDLFQEGTSASFTESLEVFACEDASAAQAVNVSSVRRALPLP